MLSNILGRIPFRSGRNFARITLNSGRSSARSSQHSLRHSRTQSKDDSSGNSGGLMGRTIILNLVLDQSGICVL